MANQLQLRDQRTGTVINVTSKKQQEQVIKALKQVELELTKTWEDISLVYMKQWLLKDIVEELRNTYFNSKFHCHFDTTYMLPDGGILCMESKNEDKFVYPILITEVKNQGTNDQRIKEGKKPQSRGNAIERLGKNIIGFRTALMRESIFPFVCFGYGCDFVDSSTILDRVTTMAMFGELNKTHLHNVEGGLLNRGSYYFRSDPWTVEEMATIMTDIARRSVMYYFSKYGKDHFKKP